MKESIFKTINRDNREVALISVDATVEINGNKNIITVDAFDADICIYGNNNTVIIPAHSATVYIDILKGSNNRVILCNSGYTNICTNDETFNTMIEVDNIDCLKLRADIDTNAIIRTSKGTFPVINDIITL